jgi:hypothetical protein
MNETRANVSSDEKIFMLCFGKNKFLECSRLRHFIRFCNVAYYKSEPRLDWPVIGGIVLYNDLIRPNTL